MNVVVVNCSTGECEVRPLTEVERQRRAEAAAAAELRTRARETIELRRRRDLLLRVTDHLEHDAAWAQWRQHLRDLPATVDVSDPVWPAPPAATSCLLDFRDLWLELDWSPLTEGTR